MSFVRTFGVAPLAWLLSLGAAVAATISFDDGERAGQTYVEDGYVFEIISNGAVSTPRGCVEDDVNSNCLLLPNSNSDKLVKMSRLDGANFSLLSFSYDGRDGEGPALFVSEGLSGGTLFEEFNVSNVMTGTGPLDQFTDVSMLFFRDAGTGSSRVDNLNVQAVPIPAAGFLLLVGLGSFAALRRRKG